MSNGENMETFGCMNCMVNMVDMFLTCMTSECVRLLIVELSHQLWTIRSGCTCILTQETPCQQTNGSNEIRLYLSASENCCQGNDGVEKMTCTDKKTSKLQQTLYLHCRDTDQKANFKWNSLVWWITLILLKWPSGSNACFLSRRSIIRWLARASGPCSDLQKAAFPSFHASWSLT